MAGDAQASPDLDGLFDENAFDVPASPAPRMGDAVTMGDPERVPQTPPVENGTAKPTPAVPAPAKPAAGAPAKPLIPSIAKIPAKASAAAPGKPLVPSIAKI